MPLQTVGVDLDWTPNTNHVGFYVARAKNFYADAGLAVNIISPSVDGYKATPASRVGEFPSRCPSADDGRAAGIPGPIRGAIRLLRRA